MSNTLHCRTHVTEKSCDHPWERRQSMPLLSQKKKRKWKEKKRWREFCSKKKSSESDPVRWGPLVVQGGITSPGGPKTPLVAALGKYWRRRRRDVMAQPIRWRRCGTAGPDSLSKKVGPDFETQVLFSRGGGSRGGGAPNLRPPTSEHVSWQRNKQNEQTVSSQLVPLTVETGWNGADGKHQNTWVPRLNKAAWRPCVCFGATVHL